MFSLNLAPTDSPLKILCLGAHADDIEIGCGGALLQLIQEQTAAMVDWVVFSATAERNVEAVESANRFLEHAVDQSVSVLDFRDGFFPYNGAAIKQHFELLKTRCAPDLIFTHRRIDAHQDHRLINELTWNTFRDHLILEYEIPKYDGDLAHTNVYVHLQEDIYCRKIELLREAFRSQQEKHWYSQDIFQALMRLRGVECRAPSGHAEAFYCHKLVVNLNLSNLRT